MAKDGRKLELYEILAAKRDKGKMPLALDPKTSRQSGAAEQEHLEGTAVTSGLAAPTIIVDDALGNHYPAGRMTEAGESYPLPQPRESRPTRMLERPARPVAMPVTEPEPMPEPKPRSPREVVFALDTAFIFFIVVLALLGSSYFLGYKRGQEERPTGLAGIGDIETSDPGRINLLHLSSAPRSTIRPSEQDYTLILRTEPAGDDLPERLELELAEAVALGRKQGGGDIQGFIFRTGGNSPLYVLAVGLGKTANDPELDRLLKIYYRMEGVTLSREPMPYRGCRVAPVRELGTNVY